MSWCDASLCERREAAPRWWRRLGRPGAGVSRWKKSHRRRWMSHGSTANSARALTPDHELGPESMALGLWSQPASELLSSTLQSWPRGLLCMATSRCVTATLCNCGPLCSVVGRFKWFTRNIKNCRRLHRSVDLPTCVITSHSRFPLEAVSLATGTLKASLGKKNLLVVFFEGGDVFVACYC